MVWAAVIGLHLIIPFMSILLDHRVIPKQLLNILPALHQDLMNYPTDQTCLATWKIRRVLLVGHRASKNYALALVL